MTMLPIPTTYTSYTQAQEHFVPYLRVKYSLTF
ncbi:hypothetical protein MAESPC_04161 [Microcystis aeruginosa SPC777]|uniref:Uncharacterized protein n=1 Tax=Microcystis aeruginosa SPC777 TaxID=482300 RepID=S3JFQ5_MICAE|nr:hypothetical protein MAESPC_04161 [Microcystis aeruginosa SPC777]